MRFRRLLVCVCCFFVLGSHAADKFEAPKARDPLKELVDSAVEPLMQRYDIPGMAIALTFKGKEYFYDYGVASRESRQRVNGETLFELGSVSKTFTATLAAYAKVNGNLAWSDKVSKHLPFLHGSSFDNISLLNLGTHTSGGLPLQVPDTVNSIDELNDYFKHWQPTYAAGTYRTYSNPSIGMLGMIAARSLHEGFDEALEKHVLRAVGMQHSYITVPVEQSRNYAQGYTTANAPVRLKPAVLAAEAYGIKATSADLLRFIEANMQLIHVDDKLQRAIAETHIAYFRAGEMTQDLIWEQYPYPVELERLLAGNSSTMALQATIATRLPAAAPLQEPVWINKTGSTNGFAAYVAFIPGKKIGLVILANKNVPVEARVAAAYQILMRLDGQSVPRRER